MKDEVFPKSCVTGTTLIFLHFSKIENSKNSKNKKTKRTLNSKNKKTKRGNHHGYVGKQEIK
jgi:hypothetical protein